MAALGAADVERLWQKLRRRKVMQWGVAYVAGAWGILQGVGFLVDAFAWPATAKQIATLVLLIGLPMALVLAWRHERAHDSPVPMTGTTAQPRPSASAADTRPSIAVLPFQNRSDVERDAHFVDGIHDDVLTQLAKVGGLKVIARTSVERFRNTTLSIREIGEQLGVTSILEGGVQRAGDRVHVTVLLVDSDTDAHLWAESYDRELTAANIFAIQGEVAAAIAEALEATLTPAERTRVRRIPTQSLAAWEAYQLGRQRMAKRTSSSLAEAEKHFQRAIDLDPQFALALAGMADAVVLQASHGGHSPEAANARATELITRALELSPALVEAITTSAYLTSDEAQFRRAIALNPNYATARHWYSILLRDLGRRDEALQQAQMALELDPISTISISNAAEALVALGRFDEALVQYQKIISIDPTLPFAYWGAADIYHLGLGRLDLAIPWAEKAATLDPGNPANTIYLAALYLFAGDEDQGCRWLRLALENGGGLVWVHEVAAMHSLYRGDLDISQAHAQTAALLDPRHVRHLVAADVHKGDYVSARARYAKAYPDLLAMGSPQPHTATSRASEIPTIAGALPFAAIDLAVVLQHTGEHRQAQMLLERCEAVMRAMPRMGRAGYGIADVAIHALRGESAQALFGLREAERAGWLGTATEAGDWHWRYERDFDPALASIRPEPEFNAIFARIEAKVASQRTRLAARPKDAPLELTHLSAQLP